MRGRRLIRRTFKVVAILAATGVAGVTVLLGVLFLDHARETTLPAPMGSYAVGRVTYAWSDATHPDPMAVQKDAKQEMIAWIWYPAAARRPDQATADYLPGPWLKAVQQQRGALISTFLTRDLSQVRTHSVQDAELSDRQASFPVVLIRAGLSGLTTGYTCLAEDLASHGFVVVGFDSPYRTSVVVFPDGRVISRAAQTNPELVSGSEQQQLATRLTQAWSADMSFALDQLERLNQADPSGRFLGRLDMQRVGAFGHSLGGATALQFCHDDARCKVGIDVDGAPLGNVISESVTQPLMFLLSDHGSEPEAETGPVMANIRSIYDRLPSDRRLHVMIRGSNHYMFSDDGAMLKSSLVKSVLRILGVLRIDGQRQIEVTSHYIGTFFDVYLKGASASDLNKKPEFPEVEFFD